MKRAAIVKFMVNKAVHGVKAGTTLALAVDEYGTLIDKQWRRRLKDAAIDNCISLIAAPTKSKKAEVVNKDVE